MMMVMMTKDDDVNDDNDQDYDDDDVENNEYLTMKNLMDKVDQVMLREGTAMDGSGRWVELFFRILEFWNFRI